MLYYEVKLINPETKEVYFQSTGPKPKFPSQKFVDSHLGSVLVIRTNPPGSESAHDRPAHSGSSRPTRLP